MFSILEKSGTVSREELWFRDAIGERDRMGTWRNFYTLFCCIKLRRNGNINITDDGRVSLFLSFL